jgi:hypothetical protein
MKPNEGKTDRIIRVILAIIIAISSFYLTGIIQSVGFIIAIALLITGVIGYCGLYTILGINTCSTKK